MTEPDPNPTIHIPWEDYEQELARFVSLSSALEQAQHKKLALQRRLDSFIQVQTQSFTRQNELDEISDRVEDKKLLMTNMLMHAKVVEEHAKTKEEHLGGEIKSLLVSGSSLSNGRKRMQESGRLLSGDKGQFRLNNLHKMLRTRQQHMISQVSHLYPLKTLIGAAQELELDLFPSATGPDAGTPGGSVDECKPRNLGALSIAGVQLSMVPFTQMSFFTDKKQVQRSTTALGYVAHVVSLIASFLHVPLRYPVRLGGSHSYIKDYAPTIEPASLESSSLVSANRKCLEFPLFLEGQEATRAAYAIFLLNKDIEQLLTYVGGQSLGPRHVLANLKELFRRILCPDYLDK